jgi:hypothetical protein
MSIISEATAPRIRPSLRSLSAVSLLHSTYSSRVIFDKAKTRARRASSLAIGHPWPWTQAQCYFALGVCKLFHARWGFSCGFFAEECRPPRSGVGIGPNCEILAASRCFPLVARDRTLVGRLPRAGNGHLMHHRPDQDSAQRPHLGEGDKATVDEVHLCRACRKRHQSAPRADVSLQKCNTRDRSSVNKSRSYRGADRAMLGSDHGLI